jgi:putative transposase
MVMEVSAMGSNLSDIMKSINLTYARYYQKKYSHSGHLWQDRFKSIVISKDEYLLACGCYVELNPVRAGMVADPALYPWSSYHFNALGKDDPLLDPHPIVSGWSSDKAKKLFQYREFVKTMMVDKNALQGEMDGRQIYGSGDFIATLSQQYHIDIGKKPIGRPRKERNYSKIEPSVFARGHLNKK